MTDTVTINPYKPSSIKPMKGEVFNGQMSELVKELEAHEDKNLSSVGPKFILALDAQTREQACRLRETAIAMRTEAQRRDAMADALDKAAVKELQNIRELLKQAQQVDNTLMMVYDPEREQTYDPLKEDIKP